MTNKRNDGDGVRKRVVEHLRKAMAATAAGAALSMNACEACDQIVCDPLPPPCEANGGTVISKYAVSPTASWVQGASDLEIALTVHLAEGGRAGTAFTGAPSATSATVLSHQLVSESIEVRLKPDGGATSVRVTLPMDCSGTAANLFVDLDLAGSTQAAGSGIAANVGG